MSTPLSVDSPPIAHSRTDSEQKQDLQEKIQRMIALQHHSTRESIAISDEGLDGEPFLEQVDNHRGGLTKRTTTELVNLRSLVGTTDITTEESARTDQLRSESQPLGIGLLSTSPRSGIGQGTLVFPSTFDHRRRISSVDGGVPSMLSIPNVASSQPQAPPPAPQQPTREPFPPRPFYAGYGSLASHPTGDLQQFQGNPAELQQHEFHYGDSNVDDPFDDHQKPLRGDQTGRTETSIWAKICHLCCPLAGLLFRDNVHRSFCFGAIDGMLTGSGIASAFCALHVLSATATWEVRVAVVVFTVAACMADAICMAIGHVWTSFVLSSAHAQERSRERESLDDDKGNAKARLVDMLLARGMLKIDAMSLADTLEGYPDMFVSALMGDSLFAGSEFPEDETDDGQVQYPTIPIGGAGRTSDGSFGGLSWKFPSYGGFNEIEHDPESHAADAVWKESQIEGFFMMFGFAVFSLIPSLLWLMIPRLVTPEPAVVIESAIASAAKPNGQVISLPSLIISISGVLMWFLGVWKSRYLESNWIMSGIENVLVLLVCVLSAYGVGYCLCYLIGGGEGVTLTNVIRHHSY